jgi:hypothetical protein
LLESPPGSSPLMGLAGGHRARIPLLTPPPQTHRNQASPRGPTDAMIVGPGSRELCRQFGAARWLLA